MEPVGLGVKVQQPLETIGGVMGIANRAQEMQQRAIEVEKSGIALGERKAIQDLYRNPQSFIDTTTGQVDYNKLIHEGMKVAPTTFPTMVPQIIQAHREGLQAQKTLNELDDQNREAVARFTMALGDDAPDVAKQKIDAMVKLRPQLKPMMDVAWNYMLAPAAGSQDAFKAAALKIGQAAMTLPEQKAAITPSGPQVTNNVQTGTMNLNPMAPGGVGIVPGTVFRQELPLGERQNVSINPVTQTPMTTSKDAFGNVIGATVTPTGPGVPVLQPGQPQDIPIVTEMRSKVNAAAAQVPEQRFNNKQIIELAPKSLAGQGGEALSKFFSLNSMQWIPGDMTKNYQQLAHFMARQAKANATAMGAGTDLARSMEQAATGSTAWTPPAIVATAKINDALAAGLHEFNQGMERAIEASGKNILAAREFQNKWTQTFDPDVYRYGNALQAGDSKEIDNILGKPGSKERAERARALAAKSARINQLVTTGQ